MQDFDLWIRLVKKYELSVLPKKTIQYRVYPGNLSGISDDASSDPGRTGRILTELYLVMRNFFDGVTDRLFCEAFGSGLIGPKCETELERKCEQAFLYTRSPFKLNQLIGVEKLHMLLHDPQAVVLLEHRYGFTPVSIAELLKSIDVTSGQA